MIIQRDLYRKSMFVLIAVFCCALIFALTSCSLGFFGAEEKPENTESVESSDNDSDTAASSTDSEKVVSESLSGQEGEIIWYEDDSWVYVNNSWLNIRSGPSTDDAILTEVYYSQALRRISVSDYWSLIILPDGQEGYAYNSYLSLEPLSAQSE